MHEKGTEKVALWIKVNGQEHHALVDPCQVLSDFLRGHLGLSVSGGCKERDCGSCVVQLNDGLTRSCQIAVAQVLHASIITMEGLAGMREFGSLQQAFFENGVTLCHVCGAATMLRLANLLHRTPAPDVAEIRQAVHAFPCGCGLRDAEAVAALVFKSLSGTLRPGD